MASGAQVAGPDRLDRRADRDEAELHLAADQVGHCHGLAAIGHMLEFQSGQHLKQLAGDVSGRALAARAHVDLPGIGLGVGDEFRDRLHRYRRMHHHQQRCVREDRDWREVGAEIERQVLVERGRDGVGGVGHEQRVAVGRRAHRHFGADVGAAARAVLDHERLAEPNGHPLPEQARQDVGRAAGRDRNDDPHRAGGIALGLGERRVRQRRQGGGRGGEMQEAAAGRRHLFLTSACSCGPCRHRSGAACRPSGPWRSGRLRP